MMWMMPRVLVSALLLFTTTTAEAFPIQPDCPWTEARSTEVLLPPADTPIPTDSSFWIRSYGEREIVIAIDLETNTSVPADELVIDLTASGGRLVELRPLEPLKPSTSYLLRSAGGERTYGTATTTSSTLTDDRPPAPPIVTGAGPHESPSGQCYSSGITVGIVDPDEPVIHLYEDAVTGSVLEVGASFPIEVDHLIPAEPGEALRFRVIAMDLAGHRSAPAEMLLEATAGGLLSSSSGGGSRMTGCECVEHARTEWAAALLAALFALALFFRAGLAAAPGSPGASSSSSGRSRRGPPR